MKHPVIVGLAALLTTLTVQGAEPEPKRITNPTGNKLYNKDGLPASPFRTDDGEK